MKKYHLCTDRSWRYNIRDNIKEKSYLKNIISKKNHIIIDLKKDLDKLDAVSIHCKQLDEYYTQLYSMYRNLQNEYLEKLIQLDH